MIWIILAIIFVLFAPVIIAYNLFVSRNNQAHQAFSTIDVMLKKRYDLVPNLIEIVKGYAKHEKETLTKLTEIRARAAASGSDDEKIRLGEEASAAIGRLIAVSESYPELKASQNFLNLQKNLTEIEEQISAARRAYNAAVTDFNNACEMFPTNLFAIFFGFKKRILFTSSGAEKENIREEVLKF
jgi:LemA protein